MTNVILNLGTKFFNEVISKGNWNLGGEIVDNNIVMHHPASPVPIVSLDAVRGMLMSFRAGFPDLNIEILDSFSKGDRAVFRWEMTGTNTGEFFGVPATGKKVKVAGTSILREANGKICENWVAEDTSGLAAQLLSETSA